MRVYAQREYKLFQMNAGMKWMTALFLLLILGGYFTGLLMGVLKAGWGKEALVNYYCGNEAMGLYPKSALELLEISHFHLLSMPVVFLIVAHLIMMTSLGIYFRLSMIVFGFLGMILDLVSPWLIRYAGAGFAWVKLAGGAVFGVSLLGMIFLELFEMFFKKDVYELTDIV